MPTRGSTRAYLAVGAAGSLWGTGFLFGKIALQELAVPHMILYRLSLAACGFVPVLLARGRRVEREDWPRILAAGALGVPVLFLVQFEGLARTTVSHAALMVGTAPILIGLAAARFASEPLTRRHWALLVASTLLWNWGVSQVPTAEAGLFVNLEPALGALLGVIVLGETLGWSGVAGGAIIIGAAVAAAVRTT